MDLKKGYVARMDQLADSNYPVINTTIASVAVSALMKDTPTQFSTPNTLAFLQMSYNPL